MAAGTFTVAGARVRTSSNRRFVAWIVRKDEYGNPVSREIFGRSDSFGAISARISRRGWSRGQFYVVIDTSTGEEVK